MDHATRDATRPATRIEAACCVDSADDLLVSGSDARDLLQRICASDVLGRGGQLCHHLVFTDDKAGLIDACKMLITRGNPDDFTIPGYPRAASAKKLVDFDFSTRDLHDAFAEAMHEVEQDGDDSTEHSEPVSESAE